jgi:hypothetical protein
LKDFAVGLIGIRRVLCEVTIDRYLYKYLCGTAEERVIIKQKCFMTHHAMLEKSLQIWNRTDLKTLARGSVY